MRILSLVLSLSLFALWVLALAGDISVWLAWFDLAVAIVAIFSGVLRASTRRLRGSDLVLGAVLLGASAYAVVAGITSWLSAWSAAIGVGFVILGAAPHFRRDVERPSGPHRHSHA